MARTLQEAKPRRVTLRRLSDELVRLRRRVEDLEDLRDLNEAIARNKGKPGIPWEQAKREIGL
jgi:cell division protein FtsB